MPKLHGFEVLRQLKEDPATAPIPVIVLSNLGQDRDVQQARAGGAAAYCLKADLSLQELVRHDELLERGVGHDDGGVSHGWLLAGPVRGAR